MGLRIAVVSPQVSNNGVTTVASFIALDLAGRGYKVCLTHTHTKSPSMFEYFGLDEDEKDMTANPARLVKMLRENILKRNEIPEYCRQVNDTLDIYSANDATFNHDDMLYALEYIVENFPYDFTVFDVDIAEIDSDANKIVLGKVDFIVVVMQQSIKEVTTFKQRTKLLLKVVGKKPMLMVINRYHPEIGKAANLAAAAGISHLSKNSSWLYLSENPYISKYENKGNIQGLYRAMKTNDARIINISSEVRNIGNRILKYRSAKRVGRLEQIGAISKEDTEKASDEKGETTENKE